MAGLALESFEPPYRGMDTETAMDSLERGMARDVTNLLPGKLGRAPLRGGLQHTSDDLWTPAEMPSGIWANASSTLLVGRGTTTARRMTSALDTVSDVTVGSDQIPADGHAAVGDTVYGISTTGDFVRWNGATTLTTYAHAPTDGVDMTYYIARLWYLGGKEVDGSTDQNALYWSDQVDSVTALPDTAAKWQDDTSSLVNKIVLPYSELNDLVGLGRLPNALCIFGSQHGHLMLGSTIDSILLRPAAIQHGCVDKRSIVEYEQGVMWMAHDGFYYFDGAQEIELSAPIRSELAAQIGSGYAVSAARLPHDYIMVTIANSLAANSWLLHVPTKSWVRFDSAAFEALIVLSTFVEESGKATVPGIAFDGEKFWKVADAVYSDLGAYDGQDGTDNVEGSVTTKLLRLASPMQVGFLNRVIFDAAANEAATYEIVVKVGADDNATITTLTGTVGASAGDHDRVVTDLMAEATEVQLTASLTASSSSTEAPEVRDLHIVFQPAFQQPSY